MNDSSVPYEPGGLQSEPSLTGNDQNTVDGASFLNT